VALSKGRRKIVTEKLPDLGNVAAAGLIFGQVISDKPFHWGYAVLGLVLIIGCYSLALFFAKEE
jgi:hypothetical protein